MKKGLSAVRRAAGKRCWQQEKKMAGHEGPRIGTFERV